MKENLHPKTYDVMATCACGNTFPTISTLATVSVEICSKCHPFFTGKQKLLDTAGRIEKFKNKYKNLQASKK